MINLYNDIICLPRTVNSKDLSIKKLGMVKRVIAVF